MKYTNNADLPLSVAVWLAQDLYNHNRHPGRAHISATGLLKPTRQTILGARALARKDVAMEADVLTLVPSRMGTSIHAGIERAWKGNYKKALHEMGYSETVINRVVVNPTPEELAATENPIPVYMEQRFNKDLGDYIIDGEFDFVGNGILEDFKSTGTYSYIKNDEAKNTDYMLQGSIYRWLAPHIITKDYMYIRFVFTDWSKMFSRTRKDYPAHRIMSKKFQLLSMPETEQFIRNKIHELKSCLNLPEEQIPKCEPKDLWQSPAKYKYYSKPENKRCQATFDNPGEAYAKVQSAGKGIVKEFPGVIRRCNPDWCNAYDLCTQKDDYLARGLLAI